MTAEMEAQLVRMMAEATGEAGYPDFEDDPDMMRQSVADLSKFGKKKSPQKAGKGKAGWEASTAVPDSPWVCSTNGGEEISEFTVPELPSHLQGVVKVEEAKRAIEVARSTPTDSQELKQSEKRKQKDEEALQAKLDRFSFDSVSLNSLGPRNKYVEACNRNKELNLILQAEKTAISQLQRSLADRRAEVVALTAQFDSEPQFPRQIANLEAKKMLGQQKIETLQTKIAMVEGVLAKYQAVFHREMEEEVNLEDLLKQSSGWRQRAQKLEIARARLEELTRNEQSMRMGTDKSGGGNSRSIVNSEVKEAELRQLKESIEEAVG